MELKIRFPEPIGQQVLRLPDPDAFVSGAVARALELQRTRQSLRDLREPERPSTEDSRPPPLNSREREDAWRRSHRAYLQSHFAGQWVVLEGEGIVAHDKNAALAVAEARGKGVAVPFVFYVEPPRQPGVVRIGL